MILIKKELNYLQIAFYCGSLPLVTGVGIYVLWRLTAWAFLPYIGMFVIWFGLFLVLIGLGCLACYLLKLGHTRGRTLGQRLVRSFLVSALLLVNIPAAMLCVYSAFELMTRYNLRIVNQSGEQIDRLVITGPGVERQLDPLAPGKHVKQYFHFRGDGPVRLSITTRTAQSTTEIDGYVTTNSGADKTIHIRPTLATEVHQTHP